MGSQATQKMSELRKSSQNLHFFTFWGELNQLAHALLVILMTSRSLGFL